MVSSNRSVALDMARDRRRHQALARSQQLPASTVDLADGETVELGASVAAAVDTVIAVGELTGQVDEADGLSDSSTEAGVDLPGVVEETAGEDGDLAFDLALEIDEALAATIAVPVKVTGLEVTSNVADWSLSGPVAAVTITWTAVSKDTDGEDLIPAGYQVFADDLPMATVTDPTAAVSLGSGRTSELRVRAVTSNGVAGELSEPVSVTGVTPDLVTRNPTAPTLTSGAGSAIARWDGGYTTPGIAGAHSIRVQARLGAGPWTPQGAALTVAGSQSIRLGVVGDTVAVRLVAFDQLSRETGVSDVVTIVIYGVHGDDIEVNSINGNRVRAGTIEVDRLEPNIGSKIEISANEAIEMIVAGQEAQGAAVAAAQETADTAAALGAAAGTAASAAQDGVDAVAESVAVVDAKATAAAAQAAETGTVLRLTASGLELGRPSMTQVLRMTPEGVAIVQNGVVASSWDAGQFRAPEAVVDRLRFANHRAESAGAGRTIIRPIAQS